MLLGQVRQSTWKMAFCEPSVQGDVTPDPTWKVENIPRGGEVQLLGGGEMLWSFKEAFHILSQFKIETPSSEQNDSQHSAPAKRHQNTQQKCDIAKHVGGKPPTKPSNGMAQLTAGIFQRGGSRRRRQQRPILIGGDGAQRRVRPRRRPVGWQHAGQPCPRPPICAKHC